MKQAPGFYGFPVAPFSLFQIGLAATEVDVSEREVLQALVIAPVIIKADEGANLLPGITGRLVVLQQDAVLEVLVTTLDFALSLRAIWRTADMVHLPIFQPFTQFSRDGTRPVFAQQPWLAPYGWLQDLRPDHPAPDGFPCG